MGFPQPHDETTQRIGHISSTVQERRELNTAIAGHCGVTKLTIRQLYYLKRQAPSSIADAGTAMVDVGMAYLMFSERNELFSFVVCS
mmetsp:Transcript_14832/g.33663  ORF Transcript_14832/g.33663 Transcript_14832/m.33663 type:complete len:87 (-) Transcript_14832:59-319(-)